MRTSKVALLTLLFVLGMLPSAKAQTSNERNALPFPTAETPRPIDRGALSAESSATPMSVTIALRLRDVDEAENLLQALHTPGDPQFHKFLTAEQFVERFGPTNADVAKVVATLGKYGLTAERASTTTLKVTGLSADMERAFAVSLHSYEVPAHGNVAGYTFHAPFSRPTIPAEIAPSVVAVVGLDSRPSLHPAYKFAPTTLAKARSTVPTTTPDAPGFWTVTDFADYYDVQPLYKRGVSGRGHTLGVMTFASFTPSDAFAYWTALGLSVNPNRIQIINVDGGPGAPSDASGSVETTLDVEQSGGIAPRANIIVYQAPNTNQGFVDVFAAAVDANSAETVSISWLSWEWFFNLENGPVTDPITGRTVGVTQATHELLVRAAIQGQTLFTASGDGGAYTVNWVLDCFPPYSPAQPTSCSQPLSVGYPGSDTAMTAAGGTTLPGIQDFCLNAACTPPYYVIDIPHERVWGWDYLEGLCVTLGVPNPITCGIFPTGGGGGVSVLFEEPWYQFSVPGVQRSQHGQIYEVGAEIASEDDVPLFYALPANYRGRNVPDVSFNADPNTGYVIYYTSSVSGFAIDSYGGGTSFVAPQLNGVTALLSEDSGGSRIGLLNYPLYELVRSGTAYWRENAPLHAIADGDNWFYHGSEGYNPAAGVGTMDVANFAAFLRCQR
jgi:kumamolisin